jgi:hypothetical protein
MNNQVSVPSFCETHPGYLAKRKPTGECRQCWRVWEVKERLRKALEAPAPHIPEHPEYGELIEKWIGRKRV